MDWIRESNLIEGIDDPKEDARCFKVWCELQRKKWSVATVLWIHRRIMFVLNRSIAGKLRQCSVRVGGYIAPDYLEVPDRLSAWVWWGELTHTQGWEEIRWAHILFEKIHPFEDGNGRVGRMLMNWQRKKAGLEPLLIEARNRHDYYAWLRE